METWMQAMVFFIFGRLLMNDLNEWHHERKMEKIADALYSDSGYLKFRFTSGMFVKSSSNPITITVLETKFELVETYKWTSTGWLQASGLIGKRNMPQEDGTSRLEDWIVFDLNEAWQSEFKKIGPILAGLIVDSVNLGWRPMEFHEYHQINLFNSILKKL